MASILQCLVNELSTQDDTHCQLCPVTYCNISLPANPPPPVQVEVEIRRCLVNEFSTQDGTLCQLCPVTYYNVNASQPCQNCPDNAMCVRPSPDILAAEVRGEGEGRPGGVPPMP